MLIALTAERPAGPARAIAQMNGFDYYLVKPCDPKVLMALIAPIGKSH
jgi:DNA-binding response OmpR family regulator